LKYETSRKNAAPLARMQTPAVNISPANLERRETKRHAQSSPPAIRTIAARCIAMITGAHCTSIRTGSIY